MKNLPDEILKPDVLISAACSSACIQDRNWNEVQGCHEPLQLPPEFAAFVSGSCAYVQVFACVSGTVYASCLYASMCTNVMCIPGEKILNYKSPLLSAADRKKRSMSYEVI